MEIENSSPLELVKFLQLEMDHIKSTATDNHGDSGVGIGIIEAGW